MPDRPASIFAVVVLYKLLPSQAVTLRSLLRAAGKVTPTALRLAISIYDNTPGGQDPGPLPDGIRYTAAPGNPGLAVAYNAAIAAAAFEQYDWLLTLDQDTDLPENFLETLLTYIKRYSSPNAEQHVAAIVPHISDHGRHLSPLRFRGGFLPSILVPDFTGIAEPFTSALNSASLLRLSALRAIGGYDERFPLNNSDTSLFHRLGLAHFRVAVVGDLTVQHELAILDPQDRMTKERYRQLLADERAFWDLHMNSFARTERLLRLIARIAKDLRNGRNREFRRLSLDEIALRLFTRKPNRLRQWKQTHLRPPAPGPRDRVSGS